LKVQPRPLPNTRKFLSRVKTPWDFKKSVFKEYLRDTDEILARCFDKDWKDSKMPKMLEKKPEEERKKIYDYLKMNYKGIREMYKFYAGIQTNNGVPSIGSNTFGDCVNSFNIVDGDLLKLSYLDIEFISTNASGDKTNHLCPERALCRYKFLELLYRLSIKKYISNKVMESPFEAVTKMFGENIF
jgi:hypothetical protein